MVLGLIVSLVAGGDDPPATPTPMPESPTPTPRPSATPLPTATLPPIPTSTCSAAERAYFAALGRITDDIAYASGEIGTLFEQASMAPDLVTDGQWLLEFRTQLSAFDRHAAGLRALEAPASLERIHRDATSIANAMDRAVAHYRQFLVRLDTKSLNDGNVAIRSASSLTRGMTQRMVQAC